MSAPMDISMSKSASDAVISEENGGYPMPQPSASSPTTLASDKVTVSGIYLNSERRKWKWKFWKRD